MPNARFPLSLTLLLTSLPVLATPLGTADMFNAYSHTTINYGSVDIEGAIGAGGNITYSGGDTGRFASGPYTVYSGGNVTISNHYVYNGGIQAGGNINTTSTTLGGSVASKGDVNINAGSFSSPTPANRTVTSEGSVVLKSFAMTNGTVSVGGNFDNEAGGNFTGSTLIKGPGATTTADGWYLAQGAVTNGPAPVVSLLDHNQVYADMVSASQGYAGMAANGAVSNPYAAQWVFSGGSSLNVFDFNGSDLAHISKFTFEGASDATYVFNISGSDIDFGSVGDLIGGFHYFLDKMVVDIPFYDDLSSRILFNFFEATNLDVYGSVFGTILAPYASVTTQSGAINGSVYANALSGIGQINNISFNGEGPHQVPEPASLALLALGLIPLLMGRRVRGALAA